MKAMTSNFSSSSSTFQADELACQGDGTVSFEPMNKRHLIGSSEKNEELK